MVHLADVADKSYQLLSEFDKNVENIDLELWSG